MKDEGLKLLPPKSNLCQECAARHKLNEPHNKDSLYYQMHFRIGHGRFPNWEDAMAHCDERTKQLWRKELVKLEVIPSG